MADKRVSIGKPKATVTPGKAKSNKKSRIVSYNGEYMTAEKAEKLKQTKKEKKPIIFTNRSQVQKPIYVQKKIAKPKDYKIRELTQEQKSALALIESGQNVFLSGEAGTGKSYVINEYIRRNRSKKNIIVCAFTGIAAINVGGATIHRVFDMPIGVIKPGDYNHKPSEALKKADVIIIDEISMCRFDHFEYVVRTLEHVEQIGNKGPKQLIVVGDFFQLPPVITPADKEIIANYWGENSATEGFAFKSSMWDVLEFKNVILKQIIRQDNPELIGNLNKIRRGDVSGIKYFNDKSSAEPIAEGISLCGRNTVVDKINSEKSAELKGEEKLYKGEKSGTVTDSDMIVEENLKLKVGMQVMTVVNNNDAGYQNGSIGKIVALSDTSVRVGLDRGRVVEVEPYEWEITDYEIVGDKVERVVLGTYKQMPIKIAYAVTIHKSQGQTYSGANIAPDCFAPGQLYVALSRVKSIEGMHLIHPIYNRALITSKSVIKFYEDCEAGSNSILQSAETKDSGETKQDSIKETTITPQNDSDSDEYFKYLESSVSKESGHKEETRKTSGVKPAKETVEKDILVNPHAWAQTGITFTPEEKELLVKVLTNVHIYARSTINFALKLTPREQERLEKIISKIKRSN